MALIVHRVAVETIAALRPLVGRIARHDRSLSKQLQAAASSIALNIGEAQYSDPGNRRARFHSAAGSAGETRTALEVAVAWGYITSLQAQGALALLDRVLAMLWRLSRGP